MALETADSNYTQLTLELEKLDIRIFFMTLV